MKLLFTTQTGEVIEMEESDYISPIINADLPPSPATLSTQLTINPQTQILSLRNRPSTPQQSFSDPQSSSPKPIIILTDTNNLLASPNMAQVSGSPSPPPAKPAKVEKIRSISRTPPGRDVANPALWMVYNEYGELVTLEEKDKQPIAEELTVTQALRLVYKVYHTEVGNTRPPTPSLTFDDRNLRGVLKRFSIIGGPTNARATRARTSLNWNIDLLVVQRQVSRDLESIARRKNPYPRRIKRLRPNNRCEILQRQSVFVDL